MKHNAIPDDYIAQPHLDTPDALVYQDSLGKLILLPRDHDRRLSYLADRLLWDDVHKTMLKTADEILNH